jgi:hypothetical protein
VTTSEESQPINSNSNPVTDSEEENKRELEKIKMDILKLMV